MKLEAPDAPAELGSRGLLMPDTKEFRILSFGYEPVLMAVISHIRQKANVAFWAAMSYTTATFYTT
jgi:hypothetical protein